MKRKQRIDNWLAKLDLDIVRKMFRDNDVTEILFKILQPNDNSKNQVYLAADFSQLGKLPSGEVTLHYSRSMKNGKQEAVFRAPLDFYWLDENSHPVSAPNAKLIYYPQYPEVRFSGFLQGCNSAPSSLFSKEQRGQEPDRILLLGIGNSTRIFGLALPPESPAAQEILAAKPHDSHGVLNLLPSSKETSVDGLKMLMQELCKIHHRGWIDSCRFNPDGILVPCNSSNCGGYTLEALLGIRPNGYSQPDFMGWEIKARQVACVDNPGISTVTLFTPEPTLGIYAEKGIVDFIRNYGYLDTKGRDDRINIGGNYRIGKAAHQRTGLRMELIGFDPKTGKYNPDGSILLIDKQARVAAGWTFVKLMDHWKKKHAHAAFVPSQANQGCVRQYRYGRKVLLGEGADFQLFLSAIQEGLIFYDPGIKLENISSGKPKSKRRSQFRVSSKHLPLLYSGGRIIDICEAENK